MFSHQVFKSLESGQLFDIFTPPTTNIIPSQDLTYQLGSENNKWNQIYAGSMIIGGNALTTYKMESPIIYFYGYGLGNACQYLLEKIGDYVTVSIQQWGFINRPTNTQPIYTSAIPQDYRPTQTITQPIFALSGSNKLLLYLSLDSDGVITIRKADPSQNLSGSSYTIHSYSISFSTK